jgi:predicted NBD/HSP70 family sugar kinase
VDIEHFDLAAVLPLLTVGCIVAIDVAKTKFVAALATSTGEVVKLVRFEHPRQTHAFLRMLEGLRDAEAATGLLSVPQGRPDQDTVGSVRP